jgi:tripartite-type tricarboxylate transporter receptor subunit TctC
MVVPAGALKPIIDKLQAALAKVAADLEMIKRFEIQSVEVRGSTQAEFKPFYVEEEKVWTTLIKKLNIKAE